MVAREARLSRALRAYDESQLDYILIDCPPSLGLLTVNALVAAAEVLIPIQCEYYALEGLEQLLRTVDLVKSHLNPDLAVSTILLTMFDGRTRLATQVADEVREHFGEVVLESIIPRNVRVSEAPSYGQSVMTYDPASSGAVAYLEAAREMAHRSAPGRPCRGLADQGLSTGAEAAGAEAAGLDGGAEAAGLRRRASARRGSGQAPASPDRVAAGGPQASGPAPGGGHHDRDPRDQEDRARVTTQRHRGRARGDHPQRIHGQEQDPHGAGHPAEEIPGTSRCRWVRLTRLATTSAAP